MFFTEDSDSRASASEAQIDPLHARKMTALLQSASSSGRPILLHYGLSGGHTAGIPSDGSLLLGWKAGVGAEQQIQDDADQLGFLWTETEQAPRLE
jgi:prolyl oligopeptidase